LKKAENDNGVILRLWNMEKSNNIIKLKGIIPIKEIYPVLLDESIIENIKDKTLGIKLKGRGITTEKLLI
jgi:alpha-mannosidase